MYAKSCICFCWIVTSVVLSHKAETVQAQSNGTYSIQTDERRVVGTPLAWDNQRLFLLSGYGQFDEVLLGNVRSYDKKSELRLVYTAKTFEDALQKEFGAAYRISRTRDFLVVHDKVQTDYWPTKIQNIHDVFRSYFEVRRFPIHKKVYPLVAIVFSNRTEFQAYAKKNGEKIPNAAVGYYSAKSNRVLILDRSRTGKMTEANLNTVIHEIVHQSAFNCGIHRRFSDTPSWVVEGLGTLFEARGVHNPHKYRSRDSRVHVGLKKHFERAMKNLAWRDWIGPLVLGDREFARDSSQFYSASWALSFFLMEAHPHDYSRYLQRLADLPTFKSYSQEQRLQDFENAFGRIDRLEGSLRNFFSKL